MQILKAELALYPSGLPIREPPSCEAPREPTINANPSTFSCVPSFVTTHILSKGRQFVSKYC